MVKTSNPLGLLVFSLFIIAVRPSFAAARSAKTAGFTARGLSVLQIFVL
jgi:hypothetical protein